MMRFVFLLLSALLSCLSAAWCQKSFVCVDALSRKPIASAKWEHSGAQYLVADAQGVLKVSSELFNASGWIFAEGYASVWFNPKDEKSDSLLFKPALIGLDEVVISSARFEESTRDVATKINIISASSIQFQNQPTTAELLQQSGQVFVQKSQLGGGSPVIRGFEASRVLIVIDGVRMNNAIFRTGHLQNVIRIDQNMLERVEVVMGPGSVMYGSDALGGVMHFITKKPVFTEGGAIKFNGQTYARLGSAANEKTGHVQFQLSGKQWSSATSISFSHFGDLRQGNQRNPFYGDVWNRQFYVERVQGVDSVFKNANPNIQTQSGYWQYDLFQKWAFRSRNKSVIHHITAQFSNSSNVNRYDRLTEIQSDSSPTFAQWYYGPEKRLMTSYRVEYTPVSNLKRIFDKMQWVIGYQYVEESRHSRRFQSSNLRSQLEHVHAITLNGDFQKKWRKHELRYGVEGWYNFVNSNAFVTHILTQAQSPAATRYPDGGSAMWNAALFISDNWEFHKNWVLNVGARVSYVGLSAHFNDTTFFNFPFKNASQHHWAGNGQLALVFRPASNWKLTAGVSSGFRAPNVDDLGKVFDSNPGLLIIPNPTVRPEYVISTELSAATVWWKILKLEVNGFFTYAPGLLTLRPFTLNGQDSIVFDGVNSAILANQNAQDAFIAGGSASIAAHIVSGLSLYSHLHYTWGRVRLNAIETPLDHIPPIFGKTGVEFIHKKWKATFFVQYNGWKHLDSYSPSGEDNLNYATPLGMPAWYTLNLRAQYSPVSWITIQASLENITDLNYRTFASGISAPGRNFILALRAAF